MDQGAAERNHKNTYIQQMREFTFKLQSNKLFSFVFLLNDPEIKEWVSWKHKNHLLLAGLLQNKLHFEQWNQTCAKVLLPRSLSSSFNGVLISVIPVKNITKLSNYRLIGLINLDVTQRLQPNCLKAPLTRMHMLRPIILYHIQIGLITPFWQRKPSTKIVKVFI